MQWRAKAFRYDRRYNMATFYNQATLSYNNTVRNSNIVSGELLEVLSITKSALDTSYNSGDTVTYIISIVNSGNTSFDGVNVSDNLGRYSYDAATELVPLDYVDGSARYYVNGVLQGNPAVQAGQTLEFTDLTVPANSNAMIIYEAQVNDFAPPGAGGAVNNTATLTAPGVTNPATADFSIAASQEPDLSITKSLSPASVAENGQLTYTFIIQNTGGEEADAGDNIIVSDTFNPILSNITAAVDGVTLTPDEYSYDEGTGAFATTAGRITVPAATFTQDNATGAWTTDPGTATLTVTGTV